MKRVTILVLYSSLTPRQTIMLRSMKEIGWDVTVIAWGRDRDGIVPEGIGKVFDKWIWVKQTSGQGKIKLAMKLIPYYFEVRKLLRENDIPDLLMVTHMAMLPGLICYRGKMIYNCSEMYIIGMPNYFGKFKEFVRPILEMGEGIMLSFYDGIVIVDSKSRWLEKHYKKWNSNVQVVWNVPSIKDDPDMNMVDCLKEKYKGKKCVAYVGVIREKKGLYVALEAAAYVKEKFKDIIFLFIGTLDEPKEIVDKMIEGNDLIENVRFLGQMSYREMQAHLRYAKVGLALHQNGNIFPYVSAGNGRKFFSYMQAGIPIVGPKMWEVGKAVEMAECGMLVDTFNARKVADAVIGLLSDMEYSRELGNNGRRFFIEVANWENEGRKFTRFIENMK